ncbi:MAG: SAM-dependent methyltransferase and glycosyltransferase, partial [Deltaproteobacteria bacterium]|nr:SAM-dependent methyltransferase and glycosyltransferase [Deltaproteobacteria bacterium]
KTELLTTGRNIFRQKYFGVDAWDDVNNFEQLLLNLVNPAEKRGALRQEVLGIDVKCGAPILQLKNKLRHTDIFDARLSGFVQDPKYWLDLKTICEGTTVVDRIEYLTEHFLPNSFDYILLGNPLNLYKETDKILTDMLSLLKNDGQLLIKLRNAFDMKAFLDSMKKGFGSGNKSITSVDINNLNKILMRNGYAIQTVRQSLYNIDNATKNIISTTLKNSEYARNINAAFNELLTEDYALRIMTNVALRGNTPVDQSGTTQRASSDTEISLPKELQTHTDITTLKEDPLSCHFQRQAAVQGMTSIVILTYNRLDHTKKCIRSIRKHTPEPHEIIFLDNGSTDGTVKWLESQVKENNSYHLIKNEENRGVAKGRNQGINISQGEFILLLDNDVIVSPGWLTGMLECLNHAPAAGIVGPMTNCANGVQKVIDESYRSIDYLDKYATNFQEHYRYRQILSRDIAGFCMLFKRALVEKIGLLDERFGADHFEDADFCLRATLEDYRNYIAGDIFVHHSGGKGPSGNRKIFDKKWALNLAAPEGKKLAVLKAMELADTIYSKGRTDQAVEALINCIRLTPDAKEIYYALVRIFIESRKFSEAWEVFGTMPDKAKNSLKGLECAGYAKEGLGLDDETAAYADSMLSLHGNHPPALNLKGVLAFKKDEKEKAQDYFKKAIATDPSYGEAHTNLGVLYWGMDKKDDAIRHLQKGFMLSPTVPDTGSLYYSVVSSLGIFSDAEADFREACLLYPNQKNLVFLYIDILIQQGKFDFALIKIEGALDAFGLDEGILNAALAVRAKIGPSQIENASKKGTLSLCMIVKNEEKHLVRCLRSVRDIVDEIIIVDTGSTDKTIEIAKVFGAKLFDFPWTGDFSAARNHSLAQATGEWILVLDGDEAISARDFDELRALTRKRPPSPVAYHIATRNYVSNMSVLGWTPNDGQYPEEAGTGWVTSAKVRLLPRRKDIFFSNPVHELVENSLKKAKIPIHPSKIIVHHFGKLDIQRDVQKGEDYYLLGKIKYESDPTNVKHIYELAKQAHQLHKDDETVELWLKLLSLIEGDPQSPNYQEIAKISYGDPLSEIYTQLAAAYLYLERYEAALETARKAMESKVKLKQYVCVYAHCEIIAGSLEKAFGALEELLKTTPDYLPALLLKAVIFCLEGEKDNAQELLILLRQNGVQVIPSINGFAKQLHTHGKADQALLILKAAMENKINNEETMHLLDAFQNGTGSMQNPS